MTERSPPAHMGTFAKLIPSEVPSLAKVVLHGRVMHAFPDIMGTNWFHLCDGPRGTWWSLPQING